MKKKLISIVLSLVFCGVIKAAPVVVMTPQAITNAIQALINNHTITTYVVGSDTPTDFTNKYSLYAWFDANNVTTPADGVQQNWKDLSGNGRDATNAVAVNRPVWHLTKLNHRPSFSFNGVNQFLVTPPFINGSFNSNFTVFIVIGNKSVSSSQVPITLGDLHLCGTATNIFHMTESTQTYSVDSTGGTGETLGMQTSLIDPKQPVILAMSINSSNAVFTVNGYRGLSDVAGNPAPTGYPYNVNYAHSFGNLNILQPAAIGAFYDSTAPAYYWNGDISEVQIWKGGFSQRDTEQMIQLLSRKWFIGGSTISFIGDSITLGIQASEGQTYPCQTMALLGGVVGADSHLGKWEAVNMGISGITVQPTSEEINGLSVITPIMFPPRARTANDIVILSGGSNDGAFIGSTNTFFYYYISQAQWLRKAGYKVIAQTILPRGAGLVVTSNQFRQFQIDANALIRANYKMFADGLSDIAGSSVMGPDYAITNTALYSDMIHPTDLGYSYIATNVAAAILGLGNQQSLLGGFPITVGSSPFSYTNYDGAREMIYIKGGTVSDISKNGTSVLGSSNSSVSVMPTDYITVTYSSIPTMRREY